MCFQIYQREYIYMYRTGTNTRLVALFHRKLKLNFGPKLLRKDLTYQNGCFFAKIGVFKRTHHPTS